MFPASEPSPPPTKDLDYMHNIARIPIMQTMIQHRGQTTFRIMAGALLPVNGMLLVIFLVFAVLLFKRRKRMSRDNTDLLTLSFFQINLLLLKFGYLLLGVMPLCWQLKIFPETLAVAFHFWNRFLYRTVLCVMLVQAIVCFISVLMPDQRNRFKGRLGKFLFALVAPLIGAVSTVLTHKMCFVFNPAIITTDLLKSLNSTQTNNKAVFSDPKYKMVVQPEYIPNEFFNYANHVFALAILCAVFYAASLLRLKYLSYRVNNDNMREDFSKARMDLLIVGSFPFLFSASSCLFQVMVRFMDPFVTILAEWLMDVVIFSGFMPFIWMATSRDIRLLLRPSPQDDAEPAAPPPGPAQVAAAAVKSMHPNGLMSVTATSGMVSLGVTMQNVDELNGHLRGHPLEIEEIALQTIDVNKTSRTADTAIGTASLGSLGSGGSEATTQ